MRYLFVPQSLRLFNTLLHPEDELGELAADFKKYYVLHLIGEFPSMGRRRRRSAAMEAFTGADAPSG